MLPQKKILDHCLLLGNGISLWEAHLEKVTAPMRNIADNIHKMIAQ
jgi:hypothetical protein